MEIKTCLFIFAIVTASSRAQLLDFLFPGLSSSRQGNSGSLLQQPTNRQASETSGNIFTNVINALVAFPIATARSLGVGSLGSPTLINDNNLVGQSNVLADYTAGSGNEDASLTCGELIVKYGHPMERHKVITEDGYVLSLFRIPNNGSVVFLMHGLLGSADDWVVAGPVSSLAYLLSAEGYDVWMGNARGNKHSRRHIKYKPSEANFWDFSWHEIGFHDLPAMIDYVLNTTEQDSLKYIGHSQGTTSFFVMTSERPDYNQKVDLMIALSPVAFMSHAKSPLVRLLSPTGSLIHGFFKTIGVYEFLPDNSMMRTFKQVLCGSGHIAEILCSNILFLLVGFGFDQLNVTNLPVIYGHVPSGAAAKQLAHYGQGVVSGEFRKFDYGSYENNLRYGTDKPPNYELSNVVAPVSLFYSNADWMSHPTDVDELYNKLSNAVDIYQVPNNEFNHLDFIWAKDIRKLIFDRVKKLLSNF